MKKKQFRVGDLVTPYMTVYNRFLSKIEDYPLMEEIERDADFVKSVLHDYLLGAIANFTYQPELVNDKDDQKECFNNVLSNTEIEILAKFMVVEYLSPYVISSNKISDRYSSKDFKNWSPANLMSQIRNIQNLEREQAIELMIENYYRSRIK